MSDSQANPGIYSIACRANGREYIGRSADTAARMYSHLCSLKAGNHPNRELQGDYDKYGRSAFDFLLVETVECADARRDAECRHITERRQVRKLYNIQHAHGSRPGKYVKLRLNYEIWERVQQEADIMNLPPGVVITAILRSAIHGVKQ